MKETIYLAYMGYRCGSDKKKTNVYQRVNPDGTFFQDGQYFSSADGGGRRSSKLYFDKPLSLHAVGDVITSEATFNEDGTGSFTKNGGIFSRDIIPDETKMEWRAEQTVASAKLDAIAFAKKGIGKEPMDEHIEAIRRALIGMGNNERAMFIGKLINKLAYNGR